MWRTNFYPKRTLKPNFLKSLNDMYLMHLKCYFLIEFSPLKLQLIADKL